MGVTETWEQLRGTTGSEWSDHFKTLIDSLLAMESDGLGTIPRDSASVARCREAVDGVARGELLAVDGLPQLDIVMLAALAYVARGKRVFIFSGMPGDHLQARKLTDFFNGTLPVDVRSAGRTFGRATLKLKNALKADIILCDLVQFVRDARLTPGLFSEPSSVALFCEADCCLYDGRLAMFDRGELQAVAAVYRTTKAAPPWQEDRKVMDLARVLPELFETVAGLTSRMSPTVAHELSSNYARALAGPVRSGKSGRLAKLVFKTAKQKHTDLLRAIDKAGTDGVVFFLQEATCRGLEQDAKRRGFRTAAVSDHQGLQAFLAPESSQRRIAFFRGCPSMLSPPPSQAPKVTVFLADHYLFTHHHQKVLAYVDKALALVGKPRLYFSLEDDLFRFYAEQTRFELSFTLIDFTERYDRHKQVRRVLASMILAKLRRLRRAYLTEEFPVFTFVSAARSRSAKAGKAKKRIGKQLDGACFCGSGKPFKDCHGSPK
ncbi:MAG: SEC-C domain-containing protein [Lentisphaerae bacterium]|nr:SEC-C domain-containing protein [Lentisphaerota bacterium]MBT4814624.1 SEC-C domain-containing protein [Lentisphaerota bacterium]MBT5605455.1 SEC-C domain-containing protein [Lentisphaerota bacterium]MBT7060114.1 SEC-C domain-containing protein [Lentisphaerota bacterium]MBT7840826.1 SEC-C domain-containing protein [Lentisphaerota bacterium]